MASAISERTGHGLGGMVLLSDMVDNSSGRNGRPPSGVGTAPIRRGPQSIRASTCQIVGRNAPPTAFQLRAALRAPGSGSPSNHAENELSTVSRGTTPSPACPYYGIADERVHALVGYGHHGTADRIQDFRCQACGTKVSAARHRARPPEDATPAGG